MTGGDSREKRLRRQEEISDLYASGPRASFRACIKYEGPGEVIVFLQKGPILF